MADFSNRWQGLFATYDGYIDGATKGTLENLASGKSPFTSGSDSDDFAGAARIAALVYLYRNDLPALIDIARAQTAFTHQHEAVIESATTHFGSAGAHRSRSGILNTDRQTPMHTDVACTPKMA